MKKLLGVLLIALLFTSCEKEELDVEIVNQQVEELEDEVLEEILTLNSITIGDDTTNNVVIDTIQVEDHDKFTGLYVHGPVFSLDIRLYKDPHGNLYDTDRSIHGKRDTYINLNLDRVIDTNVTLEIGVYDYRGIDVDNGESPIFWVSRDSESNIDIEYQLDIDYHINGDIKSVVGTIKFQGRNYIPYLDIPIDETKEVTVEINQFFNQ